MRSITYKYFVGCLSITEVKTKFKDLAKQLHPDKGGNPSHFADMKNEYDHIGNVLIFPVRNIATRPSFAVHTENSFTSTKRSTTYTEQETTTHLNPEEIFKQRATDFYNAQRVGDVAYDQIDAILDERNEKKYKTMWVWAQVQKLEDLTLNHFKYVSFKLNTNISYAKMFYEQYNK